MAMHSLEDALIDEMRDLLHAEKQLLKALPKMAKKASDPELKEAFEHHLHETENQVERLQRAFEVLGQTPRAKKCEAMLGLVEEGKRLMSEDADDEVMDAVLVGAAQKVEHYEIAGYGTACTWAEMLEYGEVCDLLHQNLEEEKAADEKLTEIAQQSINRRALALQG